uniref:Regulatory protein RecX n=1 Tax=candidate division WOR-3 bacterium TaxID=2052148 RepID=A0A7V3KNC4_UNCW3
MKDPLKYAFTLLKFRFRSENELRKRMKQKGFTDEEIESTVNYLRDKGLLNERLLAEELTEKYQSKGVSPRKIERILRGLGVKGEVIDETLPVLEINEDALIKVVEKITHGSKKLDQKTLRRILNKFAYLGYTPQETFEFLKRQGFDLDFSEFSQ